MNTTRRRFLKGLAVAPVALVLTPSEAEAQPEPEHVCTWTLNERGSHYTCPCGAKEMRKSIDGSAWRKHVDDLGFWGRNAPPHHHNCRCTVVEGRVEAVLDRTTEPACVEAHGAHLRPTLVGENRTYRSDGKGGWDETDELDEAIGETLFGNDIPSDDSIFANTRATQLNRETFAAARRAILDQKAMRPTPTVYPPATYDYLMRRFEELKGAGFDL